MGYILTNRAKKGKLRWRLVELYLTTEVVLRLTEATFRVKWGGYNWTPAPLKVNSITNAAAGATASLTIADAGSGIFQALDSHGGGIECPLNIYTVEFAPGFTNNVPEDGVQTFAGRIQSTGKNTAGKADEATISCGPPVLGATISIPARLISSLVRRA